MGRWFEEGSERQSSTSLRLMIASHYGQISVFKLLSLTLKASTSEQPWALLFMGHKTKRFHGGGGGTSANQKSAADPGQPERRRADAAINTVSDEQTFPFALS